VNLLARKKVLFVIVEGPSDDTALGVIFNRLFDKDAVHIEIMHGDITSDFSIKPNEIASKIGDIVRRYADSSSLTQKDFQQVIHIVDTDGAFIPESSIIKNDDAIKPTYCLTEIHTSKPEQLVLRNTHKQVVLNRISTLKKVWVSVPYRAYYMSCNLDHVLHDVMNCTDEDKENNAYAFAEKYKDDIDGFLSFISDSDFSRVDGYHESWEYIKKDLHSLERNTNLGLCFEKMRNERNEG